MTCNEQNDKINENAMHENKLRFKIDPSIEKAWLIMLKQQPSTEQTEPSQFQEQVETDRVEN